MLHTARTVHLHCKFEPKEFEEDRDNPNKPPKKPSGDNLSLPIWEEEDRFIPTVHLKATK